MKIGVAGGVESNDCKITIQPHEELTIEITSIVDDFFHEAILKVIKDTLKEHKLDKVKVECNDKGALDYTIKARLETAIARME